MTLDPRVGFWFSVVAAVVGGLLAASAEFTTLFGDTTANRVLAWLGIINFVINALNAVLHAIPSQSTAQAMKTFYLGPKT